MDFGAPLLVLVKYIYCNLHSVSNEFKVNEVHSVTDIVPYETGCSRRPSKSSELSVAGYVARVHQKGRLLKPRRKRKECQNLNFTILKLFRGCAILPPTHPHQSGSDLIKNSFHYCPKEGNFIVRNIKKN